MNWKSMALKITAAVLTGALALQQPVQLIAQAAQTPEYLSEFIISYGNSDEEAKKWLNENGYQIIDQNLNQGAEGGAEWMSWAGLASEKRSVYLGYKTTQNANEAITDMKIMNMNGGYSYQAYEKVLEDVKKEKEHFLSNMQKALDEYRENYKKGAAKAKIAHDALNKFYDDDTGKYMGDLLLNTIKTEDEAAWEKDPKNHADMVTILMQGNSTVVSEIMQNLALASDTADDSWLTRALAVQNIQKPDGSAVEEDIDEDDEFNSGENEEEISDEPYESIFSQNGFEAMLYQYEEKYGYDKETLAKRLVAEYDDDAKMFASSLVGLENLMTNYTKSELSMTATPEEAEAYFAAEEHQFESYSLWQEGCAMYHVLSSYSYHSDTLLTYFTSTENDYLSNDAYLEGWEEEGIPQRAMLYPFIASMSEGQRALLEYTAMNRLLTIGLIEGEDWNTLDTQLQETLYGEINLESCSVYAEVNRDDFKVGNVAVTNVAQGLQASTGQPMDEGLFGTGVSYVTAGIGVGGLVMGVAGTALLVKNWNNAVISATQPLSGGIPPSIADFTTITNKNYKELQACIEEQIKFTKSLIKKNYNNPMGVTGTLNSFTKKMTAPGPQGTISFTNGFVFSEADQTILYSDGSVFNLETNKYTVDLAQRQKYNSFMKTINRDFKFESLLSTEVSDQTYKAVEEIRMAFSLLNIGDNIGLSQAFGEDFMKHVFAGDEVEILAQLSKEDLNARIDELLKKGYTPAEEKLILKLKAYDYKELSKNKKIINSEKQLKLINDDNSGNQLKSRSAKGEQAMTEGAGSTFWKYFGLGMAIVGFVMAVYSGYRAWDEMNEYYHTEMLPIPKMMVDRGTNAIGDSCYIYYHCVPCNRASVGMANEILGDCGDLNGDVMKQWLALYTTKDVHAGNPIPAKFEVKVGTTDLPIGYLPLTFFGFSSAVNMVDEDYVYNNSVGGIYLYYAENTTPVLTGSADSTASEPGTAATTGTVTSTGSLVATGALSAAGGAAVCAGIMTLFKRKKKETAA